MFRFYPVVLFQTWALVGADFISLDAHPNL